MHTLESLRTGALAGHKRVQLRDGLTDFPREIFQLADDLEILDLSGNALCALPDDLPRLHQLRVLFCSDNQFTALPTVLGQCAQLRMIGFKANHIRTVPAQSLPPGLRWLTLTDNHIAELPVEIGQCTELQKLMLAGNRLRALPASMAQCRGLELVRLAANALEQFPEFLLDLPRLSWLAFAANPFCAELEDLALAQSGAALPDVAWTSLDIGQMLGEGASGVIHRAAQWSDGVAQAAAVKMFKGRMTSDGLPRSEMAASIRAGRHPHLIGLRGRVHAHPQGADGLVMELVDSAFQNLAAPPSLDSCTRDVYAPECRFDLATALGIASATASAVRHLHDRGILHGDLYAHNMLHKGHGQVLLGDFGAASMYASLASGLGPKLQRLEARAFGCLLEELLDRTEVTGNIEPLAEVLRSLKARCMSELPAQRPLFAEIEDTLARATAALLARTRLQH